MIQVRFKRKNEEIQVEQLRSRIADGSLRKGAKVHSAEIFGDDRWHPIETTAEWCELAPVWHVPPPGPSLSKNGLLTAVIVLGAISSLGSMLVGPSESSYWGLVQLPGIANAVIWFTVIYTMWKSIRGSFTQTTPGDAVVGFFIPGYNIYWLFGAHLGFVRNYNRVASILQDRLGRGPTRIQTWPFLAFCVAFLAWGIATVGHTGNVVTGVAEMVQYGFRALVLVKICDAVNALHDIRRDSPEVSQA